MTEYSPSAPHRRSTMQKVRDIALTVMAILVSVVCLVMLYVSFAAGSALSDLSDRLDDSSTPAPAITLDAPTVPDEVIPTNSAGEECIGEEPVPGC